MDKNADSAPRAAVLPERILRGVVREQSLEHLLGTPIEMTHPAERQLLAWVLPPWQRPEVWDVARKRAFVEGIFLGLGTGNYVVHAPDWDANGTKPMSGWLIDGQQRLSAIRDFVRDDLEIFDGVRYSDIDQISRRRRFLGQTFPYIELSYAPDEQRLKTLYERLNFGGMGHTAADLQRLTDTPALPPSTAPSGARPR